MADDFELIERWQSGDREAADEFLVHYYPLLRRFFTAKLHDDAEREDLIQETFVALVTAVENFQKRSSAKAFVLSIARNKLHDHLRKRYRQNEAYDPLHDSIADVLGKSPSSHAAAAEQSQILLNAIASLAVDDRILLELRYWHDMGSPELATIFELTPEAVRARLYRARTALEHVLRSQNPGRHPELLATEEFLVRLRELDIE